MLCIKNLEQKMGIFELAGSHQEKNRKNFFFYLEYRKLTSTQTVCQFWKILIFYGFKTPF